MGIKWGEGLFYTSYTCYIAPGALPMRPAQMHASATVALGVRRLEAVEAGSGCEAAAGRVLAGCEVTGVRLGCQHAKVVMPWWRS